MVSKAGLLTLAEGIVSVKKLRSFEVHKEFHKLVSEIQEAVESGCFTYQDVGLSDELELLELGHANATTVLLKGSLNTFSDMCVVSQYARQVGRLKSQSLQSKVA